MSGIKISTSTGNLMSLAFSSKKSSMSPEQLLTNESNHNKETDAEKKIGGRKSRRSSAPRCLSFDTVTSTKSTSNNKKESTKITEEELMADMFKTATELEDLAKKARRKARRRRNSCENKEKEGVPPRTASTGNYEEEATRRRRSRSRNGKPRRTKSTGTTEDMAVPAVNNHAQDDDDDRSVGSTGSIFSTFSNLMLSQSRRSTGSQKENTGGKRRRSRSLVGLGRRSSSNAGPPTDIITETVVPQEKQEQEHDEEDKLMNASCSHCDLLDASLCRRQKAEDLANQYKPTYYYDSEDDDDDLLLDPTESLDMFARNAEREVLNMTIAFSTTTPATPPQAA